ncbi:hypothetical protein [Aquibacillus sediminis]|uniref:hypothetical protein n=1 Tax=Aquibacillus sediminis TaxID=2574734 RepID=UPI0011090EDA|nr:hypothetical protein [Aquibacillus sediminis]
MFLLLASVGGINTGDMIIQFVSFFMLVAIPVAMIIFFIVLRKSSERLKRVEEKLDQLISETENNN